MSVRSKAVTSILDVDQVQPDAPMAPTAAVEPSRPLTEENTMQSLTCYRALELRIQQEKTEFRRKSGLEAIGYWKKVTPGGYGYHCLNIGVFKKKFRAFKQSPEVAVLPRAARINLCSAMQRVARLQHRLESERTETASDVKPWKLERLFDLAPASSPTRSWGHINRQLALAPYYLKNLPPQVERSLQPFLQWRDEQSGGLLRLEQLDGSYQELASRTAWTRRSGTSQGEPSWSEKMFKGTVRAFFGFATLPSRANDPLRRGLGIPVGKLRLAHFMVGSHVAAYLDFLVARRGACTGNIEITRRHWSMLMRGANSYCRFAQKALHGELAAVLGEDVVPRTSERWLAYCDEQVRVVEQKITLLHRQRVTRSRHRQGRSAADTLSELLDRECPMEEIVWPTVFWLADGRPASTDLLSRRFHHEVKVFTLAALASAPLRAANWWSMQWGKNLFLRAGRWKISLEVGEFKNRRALSNDYLLDIGDAGQQFFSSYHAIWKETFGYDPLSAANKHRKSIVMAKYGASPSQELHRNSISQRLRFLKKVWNVSIGVHALRHIDTTD
jgi:hypothetical protein